MLFSIDLDHIVVSARSLEEGATYVEAVLGVQLSTGGQHPHMGTHNLLLSLGPREYLEVIAIDPDAPRPRGARWFGLNEFNDAPRITNWVCRTNDLEAALEAAPVGTGRAYELSRGDYSWAMAIPDDGRLPFDASMPALMEWPEDGPHPCERLPDLGVRLSRLDVFHPEAEALLDAFPTLRTLQGVDTRPGPEKRLIATFQTPEGTRVLA
ncbi:MAG: VOC family protein [Paracoccaceae bacterium]|nr:VOC family protein [Paracoccaceae bacterium]